MDIEKGEEMQAKGMHNIFNKVKTENFPNLEKTMPIQKQEELQTDLTKRELSYNIVSLKQQV
jgi:hypothetical protein